MKHIIVSFLCLLPCAVSAVQLANCDTKSFDVTVLNGGQKHVVTLTPESGPIEEFGPVVSFQIEGQKPVVITEPDDQYCIWSGKIKIQRRNAGNESGSGFGQR